MPPFKDLVTVAGTGENSRRARQAAAGSGDLVTTAWLAHQHMLGEAQRTHAPEIKEAEDGATWLRWSGTLVSSLRALQLVNTPARGEDESMTDITTRRTTSEWLKRTGNAICIHSTNGLSPGNPTIWAIRTEFRENDVAEGVINLTGVTRAPYTHKTRDRLPTSKTTATTTATTPHVKRPVGRPPGTSSKLMVACSECNNEFHAEQLVRHMSLKHNFDPVPILVDAIRTKGPLSTASLTAHLSKHCGNAIIANSYVSEKLQPLVYDSHSQISVGPGDGSRFAFHWHEASPLVTSVPPVNAVAQVNRDVLPSIPPAITFQPPSIPPTVTPAISAPPENAAALETATTTSPTAATAPIPAPTVLQPTPSVSTTPIVSPSVPKPDPEPEPEPDPSPAAHLNGTITSLPPDQASDNLKTVMDAISRAHLALDEAVNAMTGIVTENQELRGYKTRVQRLLDVADAIKAG